MSFEWSNVLETALYKNPPSPFTVKVDIESSVLHDMFAFNVVLLNRCVNYKLEEV